MSRRCFSVSLITKTFHMIFKQLVVTLIETKQQTGTNFAFQYLELQIYSCIQGKRQEASEFKESSGTNKVWAPINFRWFGGYVNMVKHEIHDYMVCPTDIFESKFCEEI